MRIKKHPLIVKQDGFSLVELLVVLAIIGLIAALATPQVLRYLDSAKVNTTQTQMRNLQSALELYYLDNGSYPDEQNGLNALVSAPSNSIGWNGPYMKGANALQDAWGNTFQYAYDKNGSPQIISLGRDGKEGGEGLDADLK